MDQTTAVITQTKKWITDVVVGCNFCPFAAREMKRNTVHYQVENTTTLADGKAAFLKECIRLDKDKTIETTLLIFPYAFEKFDDYLDLLSAAEQLLKRKKYTGIYQVASFHPLYQFAGTALNDAANYTNRSIYPMLHLLRETQVRKAIAHHTDAEGIPARNIKFAQEKGAAYMKMLRDSCL
ncbi:DUF1415 domain-containing protein [Chitinophaga sp. MM2321]|uniref:DUF1415 domain-containing protein n=1 Tax=Chitinophaga sp. MM2321 TaxID=3137178 RepID=UPI0032D5ADF4